MGGRFEMLITHPSSSTGDQDKSFTVFRDLAINLPCFRISRDSTQRDFNNDVFPVCACHCLAGAITADTGLEMPVEFQVKQRPELLVPPENDMTSPAAIAAIGTSPGITTRPEKMSRTLPPFTGGTEDLYIIDEGVFRHKFDIS